MGVPVWGQSTGWYQERTSRSDDEEVARRQGGRRDENRRLYSRDADLVVRFEGWCFGCHVVDIAVAAELEITIGGSIEDIVPAIE